MVFGADDSWWLSNKEGWARHEPRGGGAAILMERAG